MELIPQPTKPMCLWKKSSLNDDGEAYSPNTETLPQPEAVGKPTNPPTQKNKTTTLQPTLSSQA